MTDPGGQAEEAVETEPELMTQIERAFAGVPYPGDDQLCQGAGAQLEGTEEANIAAVFRGRHWRDVPLEDLARYSATLSFLTSEAFRFYLPAYLLAAIRLTPEELERVPVAGDIEDWLIGHLQPATHHAVLWDFDHQRIDPLTSEQKAAVRSFCHWLYRKRVREDGELLHPDEKALMAYWGYPDGRPPHAEEGSSDPLPPVISGVIRGADGQWEVDGKTCQFIQQLIWNRFVHVDQREGGWTLLYHDPSDGTYWEYTYPHSEMHGGGPPVLTRLSVEEVRTLYRLPALEPC
jgi:hypothetical protein